MQEVKIAKTITDRLKKEKISPWVYKIFHKFPEGKIYLVGGTVRDFLLKKTGEIDYDFVVANISPSELEKFLKTLGRVTLVGKRFGVFKFKSPDFKEALDIALPRSDHSMSLSGKRQDFRIITNPRLPIEEDLSRRDLTINALAISLREKKLIDPFGGLADIQSGLVRAVGEPEERFKEDYSRILRAIRFACQLNFRIEKNTFRSIKSLVDNLTQVPKETIAAELLKSFVSAPLRAFDLYEQSGVFDTFLPEVTAMRSCEQSAESHIEGDVFLHTRLSLKMIQAPIFKRYFPQRLASELVLAVLFHDVGKVKTRREEGGKITFYQHEEVGAQMAKRICRRLKLSSPKNIGVDCANLFWLIKNHLLIIHSDPDELKATTLEKYFYNSQRPGKNLLKLFLADQLASIPPSGKPNITRFDRLIKRLKSIETRKEALPSPLLSGEEIIKILKIKPGPKVGEIKRALREEQLSGRVKTKSEAQAWIKNFFYNSSNSILSSSVLSI